MIILGIFETKMEINIILSYLSKLQTLLALENIVLLNKNGPNTLLFFDKKAILGIKITVLKTFWT